MSYFVHRESEVILHCNGISWSPMEAGTAVTLRGVWGNSADEVYAVGDDGTVLLFTGSRWQNMEIGITENLNDAWAGRKKEIYTVGSEGSIIVGRSSFCWQLFIPVLTLGTKQIPDGQ